MNKSWPVLIGLLLLAGCTSESGVQTQVTGPNATREGPEIGLHYFLPRGKIRMTGSNEKADGSSAFKITSTRVIEPDRSQLCFLKYHRSFFHDDDFTLEVEDNGLLKTVNATSTDQSPAIIESLTDTAINVLKIAGEAGGRKAGPTVTPRPFVYTFDPLDAKERRAAVSFLAEMGVVLVIRTADGTESDRSTTESTVSTDGVLYHPPLVVTLRFSIGTDSNDSASHVLPNPAITKCLSLRRASLVRQDTQLTFSNGMLAHVKFTRPSQALAAVQIPQKITQKVADAIPQIIKIQNEAATQELQQKTAVLQAQQNYLQAQMDLRKKEAELKSLLDKANSAKPPPVSADGTTRSEEPTPTPNQ